METTNHIIDEIYRKYEALGQDPEVYLEGLKHAKPITYWDYIEVDTLLSLQKPRTDIPDENVFIMYHQINELLFKMILSEIGQVAFRENPDKRFFTDRLGRISRYFDVLASSFTIMMDGMEKAQYMKFRNTLTPASGFQSAQYRMIEIGSTDFKRLIDARYRDNYDPGAPWADKFAKVYWQAAGYDPVSRQKSLTLRLFEERYLKAFMDMAETYREKNLWARFTALPAEDQQDSDLVAAMRHYDHTVNIRWVMAHYHAAEKYLDSDGETEAATGGSDWKKYMHPRYQKRIFYPDLWSAEELEGWGISNID